MAPSLAFSDFKTTTGALTQTSASFTPSTNDIIVVKVVTEDSTATVTGNPSGGGWTYTSRVSDTTSSHTAGYIFTAPVTTGGTAQTVAVTISSSTRRWLLVVELWTNAKLAATPATAKTSGSGTASTTLTTAAAGSVVSWNDGDWAAAGTGTSAYGGGATETGKHWLSGFYGAYSAWQSAPSAGSQTLSMTTPTGQTFTILGIEVQDAGGAPAAGPPPDVSRTVIPPGRLSPAAWARLRPREPVPLPPSADVTVTADVASAAGTAPGAPAGTVVIPNAGLAAAAGTAPGAPAGTIIIANAGLAAAAGTAPGTPAGTIVIPNAGLASAASTAPVPQGVIIANTGLASGTGTAPAPAISTAAATTVTPGLAAAAGTAPGPQAVIITLTGLAAAPGTAPAPKAVLTANAGLAAATGAAPAPQAVIVTLAGLAAATGAAPAPQAVIVTLAGLAAATGTAPAPSVQTSAQVTVLAGLAAATGTAPVPAALNAVTALATLAAATGTAPVAKAVVTAITGLAAATGTAPAPKAVVTALAGLATGSGTAQAVTIRAAILSPYRPGSTASGWVNSGNVFADDGTVATWTVPL